MGMFAPTGGLPITGGARTTAPIEAVVTGQTAGPVTAS
jgi:hypothetical protein